jgi:hypothetical protein
MVDRWGQGRVVGMYSRVHWHVDIYIADGDVESHVGIGTGGRDRRQNTGPLVVWKTTFVGMLGAMAWDRATSAIHVPGYNAVACGRYCGIDSCSVLHDR